MKIPGLVYAPYTMKCKPLTIKARKSVSTRYGIKIVMNSMYGSFGTEYNTFGDKLKKTIERIR